MNALLLLRQRLSKMTPAEKRIAACILEAPESVINETITHLASRAGTSSGSVAHFAASMGFNGFSDMKIRLAQSLDGRENPEFDGVELSDDPKTAMAKLMNAATVSFNDTYNAMQSEMSAAAKIISEASRIEIYAGGSSLPVGHDVHYRLMRLGLPAVFIPDPLLSCISASQLKPTDVALAISHKGRTTNTLAAAKMAKSKGARLIALTSYTESPIADISDVVLTAVSREAQEYREAVVSRLTQLLLIDSLCAYIAAQRGTDAMKYLDEEIAVLEQYRNSETEGNK